MSSIRKTPFFCKVLSHILFSHGKLAYIFQGLLVESSIHGGTDSISAAKESKNSLIQWTAHFRIRANILHYSSDGSPATLSVRACVHACSRTNRGGDINSNDPTFKCWTSGEILSNTENLSPRAESLQMWVKF